AERQSTDPQRHGHRRAVVEECPAQELLRCAFLADWILVEHWFPPSQLGYVWGVFTQAGRSFTTALWRRNAVHGARRPRSCALGFADMFVLRLFYKPFAIIGAIIAAKLGRSVFHKVW